MCKFLTFPALPQVVYEVGKVFISFFFDLKFDVFISSNFNPKFIFKFNFGTKFDLIRRHLRDVGMAMVQVKLKHDELYILGVQNGQPVDSLQFVQLNIGGTIYCQPIAKLKLKTCNPPPSTAFHTRTEAEPFACGKSDSSFISNHTCPLLAHPRVA